MSAGEREESPQPLYCNGNRGRYGKLCDGFDNDGDDIDALLVAPSPASTTAAASASPPNRRRIYLGGVTPQQVILATKASHVPSGGQFTGMTSIKADRKYLAEEILGTGGGGRRSASKEGARNHSSDAAAEYAYSPLSAITDNDDDTRQPSSPSDMKGEEEEEEEEFVVNVSACHSAVAAVAFGDGEEVADGGCVSQQPPYPISSGGLGTTESSMPSEPTPQPSSSPTSAAVPHQQASASPPQRPLSPSLAPTVLGDEAETAESNHHNSEGNGDDKPEEQKVDEEEKARSSCGGGSIGLSIATLAQMEWVQQQLLAAAPRRDASVASSTAFTTATEHTHAAASPCGGWASSPLSKYLEKRRQEEVEEAEAEGACASPVTRLPAAGAPPNHQNESNTEKTERGDVCASAARDDSGGGGLLAIDCVLFVSPDGRNEGNNSRPLLPNKHADGQEEAASSAAGVQESTSEVAFNASTEMKNLAIDSKSGSKSGGGLGFGFAFVASLLCDAEDSARALVATEEERDRSQTLEVAFVKTSVAELGRLATGLLEENSALRRQVKKLTHRKRQHSAKSE